MGEQTDQMPGVNSLPSPRSKSPCRKLPSSPTSPKRREMALLVELGTQLVEIGSIESPEYAQMRQKRMADLALSTDYPIRCNPTITHSSSGHSPAVSPGAVAMGTDAISPGTADRRQAVLLTVLASEAAAAARTSEELDVGAPSPEDIQILEYLRVQHEEVECVIRPAGYYRSLISKVRAEAAAHDPQAWAN